MKLYLKIDNVIKCFESEDDRFDIEVQSNSGVKITINGQVEDILLVLTEMNVEFAINEIRMNSSWLCSDEDFSPITFKESVMKILKNDNFYNVVIFKDKTRKEIEFDCFLVQFDGDKKYLGRAYSEEEALEKIKNKIEL